jgi:hypothetical protein
MPEVDCGVRKTSGLKGLPGVRASSASWEMPILSGVSLFLDHESSGTSAFTPNSAKIQGIHAV